MTLTQDAAVVTAGWTIAEITPRHHPLIADFLEACRMGRPPAVSGEEALESQRWVERILARAAESG